MTRSIFLQVMATIVLVLIGLFLINPLHLWMPSMAHVAMLAAAVAVFGALAIFVLAEGSGDERDEAHKMLAGRAAFLVGGTTLIVGILVEGAHGEPDHWLVLALILMVLAKVGARLWSAVYR